MSDATLTAYETRLILDVRRLTDALDQLKGELRIKSEFLSSRQCPDHSGKWQRGDCLQCRIEQLASALTECSDRFENCVKLNGTDPAYAAAATEPYRRLIAGDPGS